MNVYINQFIAAGRMTGDPQIIPYGKQGKEMAKFSLAMNKPGRFRNQTIFIDVSVFGGSVDFVKRFLKKGSSVFCVGEIDYSTWTDNLGEKRNTLSMKAYTVISLTGAGEPIEDNGDDAPAPDGDDVPPFPRGNSRYAPGSSYSDEDDTPPF